MSVVQLCPYDVNGENCKYETYYGEPNFSKCKNCDRTSNICKTSETILKGDKRKMTKVNAEQINNVYNSGYIAGVESSEKRIKDLEKEKSEIINLINDCLWSCVNKNFDKVEEGLKSLLNEYDE